MPHFLSQNKNMPVAEVDQRTPPPQSLPACKKWSKRNEVRESEGRETGGQAGLFLALRSFLNFSFILPVHSVLLSIAPVTRLSIHCLILPPLPLPSISLTHPDPIPSLLAPLSNLWGPALATIQQPDGPPLTGTHPSPNLSPWIPPSAKHPHTHMHTATWPFSTLRPVSGSCYANREEGMEGGRDEEERQSSQPIVKGQREGEQGDWPRSSISIAMPEQQQTSCYTKGVPLPTPAFTPLFPSFSFKSILYPSGKGSCKCSM